MAWQMVTVNGKAYRVTQLELADGQFTLDGEPFTPGRKWFGAGSWLIQGDNDAYAWAMTNEEYLKWRDVKPGLQLKP